MSRPRRYTDEEILKVAAEVFLEQGASATTALIARRAGVSEGILFKRFKTKEALFEAALVSDTESDHWRQELIDSAGRNTPHLNLKNAILALFTKLEKLIPKLKILEGRGHHRPPPLNAKAPPLEDAAAIAAYLKKEIKIGRLALDRPDLHAHEIVGAVVHATMLQLRHQAEICSPTRWANHLAAVHLATLPGMPSRKTPSRQPR
jgi:AcrR family transcriptional regulator